MLLSRLSSLVAEGRLLVRVATAASLVAESCRAGIVVVVVVVAVIVVVVLERDCSSRCIKSRDDSHRCAY